VVAITSHPNNVGKHKTGGSQYRLAQAKKQFSISKIGHSENGSRYSSSSKAPEFKFQYCQKKKNPIKFLYSILNFSIIFNIQNLIVIKLNVLWMV
jgi:hypothetical protein